jgi:pimeloyl-ACP methyl ester carboxylesterase
VSLHSAPPQHHRTEAACRRGAYLAALASILILLSSGAKPAHASPATLTLGSQTLGRCAASPLTYCGRIAVPLDYAQPAGPRITVAFRWYPAADLTAGSGHTVVPVEGGPGFPSIGSVSGGFGVMYGPLLERWNMLVLDNRGTGASTALDCPALQGFSGPTDTAAFQQTAASCAEALNHRWRYPDGSLVHASDLFSSAPAAEDLAAVIAALELPKVDLYGDSYGSFFAQVFAARFPRLVRSVILDSTYETVNLDPWYRSAITSMPAAFDQACARAPACAGAAPGSSWARLAALAQLLRAKPISGVVPGPNGTLQDVTMNAVGLVDLLNDAAADPLTYRAIDASARALEQDHDPAPLLRLYAQRLALDESYFGLPASQYSVELYLASSCLDYPQLFDINASPAVRAAQLAAAEAGLPPVTFSPFATAEWIQQNQNTEAYTACLDWPVPAVAQPPTSGVLPLFGSTLPVLVLGGEFDTWTPPGDSPKVLAEIGGHSRFVQLANATHVVGQGDTLCGSILVRVFVVRPAAIDSLDTSCAATVPPIHAVGAYPDRLAGEPPIEPSPGAGASPGSGASPAALRLAAAAVATAGDAVARAEGIEVSLDHGLFGGTVTIAPSEALLTLHDDRLLPDVAVSGTVKLAPAPNPLDGEAVVATLTAKADGLPGGSFTASWTTAGAGAEALVSGAVGDLQVSGKMPAP